MASNVKQRWKTNRPYELFKDGLNKPDPLSTVFTDPFFLHAFPCKCERHFCVWNGNKCVVAQRTTTSIIERCKQQNNQHNCCFQRKGIKGIKINCSNIFSLNFVCLPPSLALLWHLTSAMPFRPVKCYSLFLGTLVYLYMTIPLDQLNC